MQWGENTKKGMIAQLASAGMTKRDTYNRLRPLVESGLEPMVYKRNPTASEKVIGITHRIPKSPAEQLVDLKNDIGRVYSAMGKSTSADFDAPETDAIDTTPTDATPTVIEDDAPVMDEFVNEAIEVEEDEPTPVRAKGKKAIADSLNEFARRMKHCRDYLASKAFADPIDELGLRPEDAARKLIPAGVPVEALIDVMTLTWPEDARNEVNATKFGWEDFSAKLGVQNGISPYDAKGNTRHVMFPYLVLLAENRIPIWLGGPMGTGKSTLARQLAEHFNLPYGETALSAGATRGDLLGRLTASQTEPFILSKFCEIYSGGGVFCFEEIDAALPDVLITLNNAMAGDSMFNSANGLDYDKHADVITVATANTWGTGANMLYLRERLDAATLDRFRMGRVFIRFDQSVADKVLFGN